LRDICRHQIIAKKEVLMHMPTTHTPFCKGIITILHYKAFNNQLLTLQRWAISASAHLAPRNHQGSPAGTCKDIGREEG
jgi:hypothetical protein